MHTINWSRDLENENHSSNHLTIKLNWRKKDRKEIIAKYKKHIHGEREREKEIDRCFPLNKSISSKWDNI